jgi:hypothetical protein
VLLFFRRFSPQELTGKVDELQRLAAHGPRSRQTGATSGRPSRQLSFFDGLPKALHDRAELPPEEIKAFTSRNGSHRQAFLRVLYQNMQLLDEHGEVCFAQGSDTGVYELPRYSPDRAPRAVKTKLLENMMNALPGPGKKQMWVAVVTWYTLPRPPTHPHHLTHS